MSRLPQLMKLLALDPNDTFVLYGLAAEHAKVGNHAEAVSWYRKCLAADPAYLYAYFHMAKSLQAMGNLAEARAVVADGVKEAHRAGDGKAIGELSQYQVELAEVG
jgi:tetratricopeptide (TPR) repeat protein